jgi:hypothetical protein
VQRAGCLVRASTKALVRSIANEILPLLEAWLPLLAVSRQFLARANLLILNDLTNKIISITVFLNNKEPLPAAVYAALPLLAIDPIQLYRFGFVSTSALTAPYSQQTRTTRGLRAVVTTWRDHFDRQVPVFSLALMRRARPVTGHVCACKEAQAL